MLYARARLGVVKEKVRARRVGHAKDSVGMLTTLSLAWPTILLHNANGLPGDLLISPGLTKVQARVIPSQQKPVAEAPDRKERVSPIAYGAGELVTLLITVFATTGA